MSMLIESIVHCAVVEGPYLSSREREGVAAVACEALALFALNPASHRSLQAADSFQRALSLLGALRPLMAAPAAARLTTDTEEKVAQ